MGARVLDGVYGAVMDLINLEKVITSYCTSPWYTDSESYYLGTGLAGLVKEVRMIDLKI